MSVKIKKSILVFISFGEKISVNSLRISVPIKIMTMNISIFTGRKYANIVSIIIASTIFSENIIFYSTILRFNITFLFSLLIFIICIFLFIVLVRHVNIVEHIRHELKLHIFCILFLI